MKKSISRTLAHIDVAATVPFAFTKTFSTPTGFINSKPARRFSRCGKATEK
jgi:hypothetical protein